MGRLRVAADEGRPSLILCLVFCDAYCFSYEDRISIGIGEIRVLVVLLVLESECLRDSPSESDRHSGDRRLWRDGMM